MDGKTYKEFRKGTILEVLEAERPQTAKEIAKATKIPYYSVFRDLKELVQDKMVTVVPNPASVREVLYLNPTANPKARMVWASSHNKMIDLLSYGLLSIRAGGNPDESGGVKSIKFLYDLIANLHLAALNSRYQSNDELNADLVAQRIQARSAQIILSSAANILEQLIKDERYWTRDKLREWANSDIFPTAEVEAWTSITAPTQNELL